MENPVSALVIGGVALMVVAMAIGVVRFCLGIRRVRQELVRQVVLPVSRVPAEADLRMIVRLSLEGRFGTPEHQAQNRRFAQEVEAGLSSGTVIRAFVARGVIFFTIGKLEPAGWRTTLELVLSALRREGLDEVAVVVRREEFPGDPNPAWEPIWPENFRGDFYDIQTDTCVRFG